MINSIEVHLRRPFDVHSNQIPQANRRTSETHRLMFGNVRQQWNNQQHWTVRIASIAVMLPLMLSSLLFCCFSLSIFTMTAAKRSAENNNENQKRRINSSKRFLFIFSASILQPCNSKLIISKCGTKTMGEISQQSKGIATKCQEIAYCVYFSKRISRTRYSIRLHKSTTRRVRQKFIQ